MMPIRIYPVLNISQDFQGLIFATLMQQRNSITRPKALNLSYPSWKSIQDFHQGVGQVAPLTAPGVKYILPQTQSDSTRKDFGRYFAVIAHRKWKNPKVLLKCYQILLVLTTSVSDLSFKSCAKSIAMNKRGRSSQYEQLGENIAITLTKPRNHKAMK